jgi:hypothetical protein
MDSYTRAATERAMKVQEVILRAAAKKITGRALIVCGGSPAGASACSRSFCASTPKSSSTSAG